MQFYHFTDEKALNYQFAQEIVKHLHQAIASRGHAYFAVSGGKTPQSLFKILAQTEFPWQHVTVTLTDERWLAPSDSNSNEHGVKTNLLQHHAKAANFISLYCAKESPYAATKEIEARLSTIPKFDLVILGMGEDGHTASLFPCSAEIQNGLMETVAPVLAVTPTTAPFQRISLTKTRLLNSQTIYLHLTGKKKLAVLENARAGSDSLAMPIRAFLNHPAANVQVMFSPT